MKEQGFRIGILHIVTLVFIILDATGVINWPWYWILSPILFPIAALLAGFGLVFLLAAFVSPTLNDWALTVQKWLGKIQSLGGDRNDITFS